MQCGTEMIKKTVDRYECEVCPSCNWVCYQKLKVGAGALIGRDGKLLMLQRSQEPWQGWWNLPAGYTEIDEAPASTAVREAKEETGLVVKSMRFLGQYFFDNDPRGNGLLLLFYCSVISGDLILNHESLKAQYFLPDEIPLNKIAGGGHQQAIRDWMESVFE